MVDVTVEPVVEPHTEFAAGSIAAGIAVVVLVTAILLLIKFLRSQSKNTFLIAGLSDSGKTLIFTKLISDEFELQTYTSLKENVYDKFLSPNGTALRIVDYPGAERLRQGLFDTWLSKEVNTIRGIIFVIDSATFNKKVRDVAELLYDVIFQLCKSGRRNTPLLIACSKQDNTLAKSEKAIRESLEREFGLINNSRAAALSSTEGDTNSRVLYDSGDDEEFTWDDLRLKDCVFLPVSATEGENYNLAEVRAWIDKH
uniref:Signal recognition particle receptor subunit beta n=1 Tax=Panagrellus redivivus TaxID=6233 RepID=A0A7E4W0S2_PANRE